MIYALHGRVGLVTGAGGGIGRAIARRLTREGMAIAVLDRNGAAAEAIAAEIGGLAVTAGVTCEDEVGRAVDVFRFAAIEALRDDGETFAGDVSERGRDRRAYGPCEREVERLAGGSWPYGHAVQDPISLRCE